ncbi:MAG: hypothetical protein FJX75_12510 [Armatimonadetes bacterium]|nr:hypothetical protein [Armatimonadota bacterium]
MATWQDRWRDAGGFWDLAHAGYDPKSRFGNPAASNAIMAVIAANDAVCLRLGRRQPKGDSHTEAAMVLTEACRGTEWESEASDRCRQLREMLAQRTAVQYLGKPLPAGKLDRLMKQAERFMDWARGVLATVEAPTPRASAPTKQNRRGSANDA